MARLLINRPKRKIDIITNNETHEKVTSVFRLILFSAILTLKRYSGNVLNNDKGTMHTDKIP